MAANLLKFDSLKIATTVTMALGILLIIALGFLGRNVLMAIHKRNALQSAMANPTQIMMDARLFPNLVKDRQEGFILREIRKDGFYDHLGLQNGDVLLQVNGSSISSPENALQAFMALKGMDRVKLDIIRNSNRLTLNYQIR